MLRDSESAPAHRANSLGKAGDMTMFNLPFISYTSRDARRASEMRKGLSQHGKYVLSVERKDVINSDEQQTTKEMVRSAMFCLILAEPEDIKNDPMFLYILGIANASDRPVTILTSSPISSWPQEIRNGMASLEHWPRQTPDCTSRISSKTKTETIPSQLVSV
jgi:hypothetical protein